jgi:DNA mismatch endonuclease (patch repair protein)
MSRIRSKNTKPEMIVRKVLFANGFRFRLHDKKLPGKPDIVLKRYNTVIFIHGCFWHGHADCKYFLIPKTRTAWWLKKINRNKELDIVNGKKIKKLGWNLISIYECDLKTEKLQQSMEKLIRRIKKA